PSSSEIAHALLGVQHLVHPELLEGFSRANQMLHAQKRVCDFRARRSCLVETAKMRVVVSKRPAIGVATSGESPGLSIQGCQFLLKIRDRDLPVTFVQVSPQKHHPPRRRSHAQSKIRIERAYRVPDGDQSRGPSCQPFVVHHAIRGGSITKDWGYRPRTSERRS